MYLGTENFHKHLLQFSERHPKYYDGPTNWSIRNLNMQLFKLNKIFFSRKFTLKIVAVITVTEESI